MEVPKIPSSEEAPDLTPEEERRLVLRIARFQVDAQNRAADRLRERVAPLTPEAALGLAVLTGREWKRFALELVGIPHDRAVSLLQDEDL